MDPDGAFPDFFWDLFNAGIGSYSLIKNIFNGNGKEALQDAGAILVDGLAAIIPFVPGGASTSLKAKRTAEKALGVRKTTNKVGKSVKKNNIVKKGPKGNDGVGKKHGNSDHNKAIDDAIEKLPKEAKDVRKNQVQVDINGNKVGNNRPDIQYNKDGKHYNVEIDRNIRNNKRHQTKIKENDPDSEFEGKIIE